MASRDRKRQQVSSGHGSYFLSPSRPWNVRKTKKLFFGNPNRGEVLRARLKSVLSPQTVEEASGSDAADWMNVDEDDDPFVENTEESTPLNPPVPPQDSLTDTNTEKNSSKPKRRILPDAAAYRLYNNWKTIVPTLINEYLNYINTTTGKAVIHGCSEEILRPECTCGNEKWKTTSLTCLFFDRESFISPFDSAYLEEKTFAL